MKIPILFTAVLLVSFLFMFIVSLEESEKSSNASYEDFVICNEVFSQDTILDIQVSKPFTAVTKSNNSIEQGYSLGDLNTTVFENCSESMSFTHSLKEIQVGNSINEITLVQGILLFDYHVNPDVSIIRRIDLNSEEELYFQKYWKVDGSAHIARMDSSLGEIVSYSNQDYGFKLDYDSELLINEKTENPESRKKFNFEVYDYTCGNECLIINKQSIFSLNIYYDVGSIDSNYSELKEFISEEKDPIIDGESLGEVDLKGDKDQCWEAKEMKESGVVRLYSEVYCNYNDDVYHIHSNIPTPTYKSYDEEFSSILESFEFLE